MRNVTDPLEDFLASATDGLSMGTLTPAQRTAASAHLIKGLVTSPLAMLRKTVELTTQLGDIALGTSAVAPEPGDRRFTHTAWQENPFYKRLGQGYLAWRKATYDLVDEIETDEADRLRSRFLTALMVETLAPTNTLVGNPAALETALQTGGKSLLDGFRHAVWSLQHNGGLPAMVDTRPFKPGETVAATPGAVIFRNDVLELIQYQPSTKQVQQRPLLIVPPQINKFYILDLAPGRSLVEYAVSQGQQVFMISWRNPNAEMRDWDLDKYVASIQEAMEAALEITGSADLNLMGVCAGGITTAALMGHLTALGDDRVHALTFLVTVLDWDSPSTVGSLTNGPSVTASMQQVKRAGVLDGKELSRFFAWMRPNDLIWNYWVNNVLMGKNPPAFDVLSWNVDATNLPAGLHADFSTIAADNAMCRAGAVVVGGEPINLGKIDRDAYVVGAETDHITPWQACYQTIQLLGGRSEFVLSNMGHVQVMVNPPDNPKARYFTNPDAPSGPGTELDAAGWLAGASEHKGSWWEHWAGWLNGRSGELRPAPEKLGSKVFASLEAAPGSYVKQEA
ncbi:MAG: alpha/beta fold hydrolase [Acidimicrobiales bacterium]